MNEKEFNKKERQKLIIAGIFCLIAIISVIGYTYSYFIVSATDSVTITGTVASTSLSLTVEKLAPDTDKDLIPQLDSAIASAVVGTQGNCIDDNLNTVCQVYQVTVTNTSSMAINVDGTLELNAGSNPNLKWALIDSYADGMTTKPTVTSSIKSYVETTITANEEYSANEEKIYYIVVWISETGYVQSDTGSFTGVVTFANSEESSAAATTLYSLGIAPKKDVLTTFTTSSNKDGTTGVYKAEDDLGTSYYFRGDIKNNYVRFGQYTEDAYALLDTTTYSVSYSSTACDTTQEYECTKIASAGDYMYWRIVRINGDGTIRMVYTGTKPYTNSDEEALRNIGYSVYNLNYDDNAYVGYMYGTAGSSTYEETHANTTDSTIKTTIDNWYYKYLYTNYSSYITDAIYCNDRSISNQFAQYGFTTDGFGNNSTGYGIADRYNFETGYLTPILKCENTNDRFTMEDTINEVVGNSELTYPVAMLTADELVYAGGMFAGNKNNQSYIYDSECFWSLSPYSYDDKASVLRSIFGYLYSSESGDFGVFDTNSVRPVLSLSSEAITSGNGTINSPFLAE